jgi:hypothetical protein
LPKNLNRLIPFNPLLVYKEGRGRRDALAGGRPAGLLNLGAMLASR